MKSPLGVPGEGADLPWVAEGNLTLQQVMLLQGLACPRGTLRPECRWSCSVTHMHTSTFFHTHFLQELHFSIFCASFTLKLSQCMLLLTWPGEGCTFLLFISLLDHRIVFTLGIPAVQESTVARLAQEARTGFSSKDRASC